MNTDAETKPLALTLAWGFAVAAVSLLVIGLAVRHAVREMAATRSPTVQHPSASEDAKVEAIEPEPGQPLAVGDMGNTPIEQPIMAPEDKAQLIKELRQQAEASAKSDVGPSALAPTEEQIRFIEEHDLILQ